MDGRQERRGRSRSRSRSLDDDRRRDKRKDAKERDHRRPSSRSPPPKQANRRHSRSRSRARSPQRHSKRRRSRSRSRSRDRSRSRSRSSSGDSQPKKRKHHKKRRRSRSRSKDRSRSRSPSRERRKKKKDKKEKKDKKSKASTSHGPAAHWGKYGIISEADMFTKEQEFRLWLLEEKHLNSETVPKPQLKKLFASFAEDYNTATLPHEKYYALEAYEARMLALRSGASILATQGDAYDWQKDMMEHKKGMPTTRKGAGDGGESFLSKEQLMELRKVQNERVQVGKMKALGLEVKQSMGVRMDGNEFE